MKKIILGLLIIPYSYAQEIVYSRASYEANQRHYADAQKQFESLLLTYPDRADLLYDAGVVCARQEDYAQASIYFNACANKADSSLLKEQALFNAGNMNVELNQLEEALKKYNEALKLNKENKQTIHNKKIIEDLLKQKQQEEKQQQDTKQQQEEQDQQEKEQNQNQEKTNKNKNQQGNSEQKKRNQNQEQQESSQDKNEDNNEQSREDTQKKKNNNSAEDNKTEKQSREENGSKKREQKPEKQHNNEKNKQQNQPDNKGKQQGKQEKSAPGKEPHKGSRAQNNDKLNMNNPIDAAMHQILEKIEEHDSKGQKSVILKAVSKNNDNKKHYPRW